jgi:hypothetical protein
MAPEIHMAQVLPDLDYRSKNVIRTKTGMPILIYSFHQVLQLRPQRQARPCLGPP